MLAGRPSCFEACPWNSATMSICYCRTVVTILVGFVVAADVSSCSISRSLFLKFSIL